MDKKIRPTYMQPTRDSTSKLKTHTDRNWRDRKKDTHANRNLIKTGIVVLIWNKIDFKTKTARRDNKGHYIMIKGSFQQEDITIVNIYTPNGGASKYKEQILTG